MRESQFPNSKDDEQKLFNEHIGVISPHNILVDKMRKE